jgi:hypothetical protein
MWYRFRAIQTLCDGIEAGVHGLGQEVHACPVKLTTRRDSDLPDQTLDLEADEGVREERSREIDACALRETVEHEAGS